MIFKKIFCLLFAIFGEPSGYVERPKAESSERKEYEESEGHTPYADLHSSSEVYARRFSGGIGEYFLLNQGNILRSCIPATRKLKILEVGGGHGQSVDALIDRDYDITVLGTGAEIPDPIRAYVEEGTIRYVTGSFDSIPCDDNSFDVCICLRQLSHMVDPAALIGELSRVASQSVILDFAPLESFNALYPMLFKIKKRMERSTRQFTVFDSSEIERQFALNGFGVARQHRQYVLPMAVHRILGRPSISRFIEKQFARLGVTRRYGSPLILHVARDESQLATASV